MIALQEMFSSVIYILFLLFISHIPKKLIKKIVIVKYFINNENSMSKNN